MASPGFVGINNRKRGRPRKENRTSEFPAVAYCSSNSKRGRPTKYNVDLSPPGASIRQPLNEITNIQEGMKFTNHDLKESAVSSEAKKRLLERLRMAHKYHGVGVNSKGSPLNEMYQDVEVVDNKITPGEMLSTPDVKMRNSDVVMGGKNSRDGWRDNYSNMSSRVRSVRPLSGRASEKHNTEREHRIDDKLLVPKADMYQCQRDGVHRNGTDKQNILSKSLRSTKRRSQPDRQRYTYDSNSVLESHSNQDQMKTKVGTKVSPEMQLVVPQTPNKKISITNAAGSIENRCGTISPGSSDELPPELLLCTEKFDDSCVGDQVDTTPQCTRAEAEPSESSKEADHPSPISVLDVTPGEDNVSSGPESFEQVSADLRELQKQLKLLRREFQAYAETSTLLSDDNDVQQGPVIASENIKVHRADCWESSSYIIDVLTESGFDDIDMDMFIITWYSPDSPLGQWIFDNVENKHYGEGTRSKHDRKLLFDRINSALLERRSITNLNPILLKLQYRSLSLAKGNQCFDHWYIRAYVENMNYPFTNTELKTVYSRQEASSL